MIESDAGPVPFRGTWELEPAGPGTRFTWILETGGIAARMASAVARQELAANALRLKELLEAQ